MKRDDLLVEVRDANLTRLGIVTSDRLVLDATALVNQVGSWKLTLPSNDPLIEALRSPGSGIIVSGPDDVILSGPTTSPESSVTAESIGGDVTFTGVCDNVWAADRLAYPQPSNIDTKTQSVDFDERTGAAETVVHAYVNANLGPSAPVGRRHPLLAMGLNTGNGPTITKSARFDNLGELITGIANANGLRWRIVQRGDKLVFETRIQVNRSASIRLSTRYNTLSGYRLSVSAPTATHAIVGAQDVTFDRVFATVTTPESQLASATWGRRIERFVNQAYSDNEDEFTASAREMLATEGVTSTNVQAMPADDTDIRFGKDWDLGDLVTVVADNKEYMAPVTGMVLKADRGGVQVGAVLGDVTAFNETLAVRKEVSNIESRLSVVERNLETVDVDSGWINLSLGSGWTNYGVGGYPPLARVRKDGDWVVCEGTLLRATGAATTAFILPSGFRPKANLNPPTRYFNGAAVAAGTLLITAATGAVSVEQPVNGSTYELGSIAFYVN